jgi:hypothetical protein
MQGSGRHAVPGLLYVEDAMQWWAWILLVVAGFAVTTLLYMLRDRSNAKAEQGLSPEEIRKKRALEDMADNLSP